MYTPKLIWIFPLNIQSNIVMLFYSTSVTNDLIPNFFARSPWKMMDDGALYF